MAVLAAHVELFAALQKALFKLFNGRTTVRNVYGKYFRQLTGSHEMENGHFILEMQNSFLLTYSFNMQSKARQVDSKQDVFAIEYIRDPVKRCSGL